MKVLFLFLFGLVFSLTVGVATATAQEALPNFPSCVNPGGTLIQNNDGIHGIVGVSGAVTGNDKVYTLATDTTLQCFCPPTGNGIQTNWVKVSDLTQDEIDTYSNLGWQFIPSGLVWGLQDAQYLAKNLDYSCNGGSGGSGGGSSTGQVLGTSTVGQVLGLAGTGTTLWLIALIAIGVSSLLTAVYMRRHAK